MVKYFSEQYMRIFLLGIVLLLNVVSVSSSHAYQVSGGNFLKIVQSGGHTGSNSFQVKAHLKPMAHPEAGPVETTITPTEPPVITTPSTPSVPSNPKVVTPVPQTGGGEKYDASAWILNRKYDELVRAREEEKLKASAPKKEDFTIIPKAKAQKKTQTTNQTEDLIKLLVSAPKGNGSKLVVDLEKVKPSLPKEVSISELHTVAPEIENSESIKKTDKVTQKETETSCPDRKVYIWYPNPWEPLVYLLFGTLIGFFFMILFLIILVLWMIYTRNKKNKKTTKKTKKGEKFRLFLSFLILVGLFGGNTLAITTTPQKIIYEGELLDNAGNPVSGDYDFRFSLWDNQDYELTDTLAGSINVVATDFFGWQEVQSQNISNHGKFSFQVGTVVPFTPGLFDRVNMSLQIEVKPSGAPDSSYELIDLDTTNPVIDRMVIDSVPYAFNADKLDFHEAGFGAGQIPYLDLSGKFPTTVLPIVNNALNAGHADSADNANTVGGKNIGYNADEIPYQDASGKLPNTIIPDIDAVLLDGRDTGYTAGDIPYIDPITGLLPSSIIPFTGSGGVASNIPGTDTSVFVIDQDDTALPTDNLVLRFGTTLGETILWNGVSNQFEISDDVTIQGGLTVSGTINGVTIGLKDYDDRLSPRYPNSILEADGTDNDNGYMYEEEENVLGNTKNILRWTTTSATTQDYDVIIRYPLKDDFNALKTPALSLEYLTELTATDTKLDLTVTKEGVAGDQLGGSGISLTSNTWVNQDFSLTGGATWSAGDVMIIRMKMYAKNNANVKVGDIVIHTIVE